MPLAPTLLTTAAFGGLDNTQKLLRVYFKLVASGSYPALGDTLDFTALGQYLITSQLPLFVQIQSQASPVASGYLYEFVPGTTLANGKMQVLKGATGALVDLGAGAYPAAITGDNILGYADFPRL